MRRNKTRGRRRRIITPFTILSLLLCIWLVRLCLYRFAYTHDANTESQSILPRIEAEESGGIKIEVISDDPTVSEPADGKPAVLIYHTHTTEAYLQSGEEYKESGKWRTHDNGKNVVAVGEKLARLLRSRGIAVIHDTTDHEPPKLATSYSRSVKTMERYREKYPSITMYIDLHRDSYGKNPTEAADFVTIDGKESARLMFVVGTGKGATGTGYTDMPDFDSNYALAERITRLLMEVDPELARDIRVKPGRYNQHISNQCLLVEVGHNANTLEQAMNSIDYLAAAIAAVFTQGNG